jgi:hypothetical protein
MILSERLHSESVWARLLESNKIILGKGSSSICSYTVGITSAMKDRHKISLFEILGERMRIREGCFIDGIVWISTVSQQSIFFYT